MQKLVVNQRLVTSSSTDNPNVFRCPRPLDLSVHQFFGDRANRLDEGNMVVDCSEVTLEQTHLFPLAQRKTIVDVSCYRFGEYFLHRRFIVLKLPC